MQLETDPGAMARAENITMQLNGLPPLGHPVRVFVLFAMEMHKGAGAAMCNAGGLTTAFEAKHGMKGKGATQPFRLDATYVQVWQLNA